MCWTCGWVHDEMDEWMDYMSCCRIQAEIFELHRVSIVLWSNATVCWNMVILRSYVQNPIQYTSSASGCYLQNA